ncbi:hypothetical protein GCM10007989_00800 [Devosia pacifica]|uniref:Outer membrane protein beta-barrel domain-containing protein n=1 Tax=Devosia pacifica TaxID=1335967 RepID=A0A918RRL4_9HYPH|nr:outer membrane beta-barrel protein [Devosia pacifica]GHA10479.1 hypothetical protein GCM10007989_00800 [Devosia pacifica]
MRILSRVVIAALTASVPAAVHAADLNTVAISAPSAELPVYDDPAFDWSGFYAGVFTGVQNSDDRDTELALGLNAGVNAQFDFYLLGAEVAVQGLTGDIGESVQGQILGRAGLVVTDNVAVYGAGGYGLDLDDTDEGEYLLGGGVELAVNEDVSVRAQYLHGFDTDGGGDSNQVTIGAAYHF